MDFVGNLILLPTVKNFENPLRIDKIIAMSVVYYFFGTQCSFTSLRAVVIFLIPCSRYCSRINYAYPAVFLINRSWSCLFVELQVQSRPWFVVRRRDGRDDVTL